MNSKSNPDSVAAQTEVLRGALQTGRVTINTLDDGSGVLLDIEGEQLLTLNRTGMHLVKSVHGGARTLDALAAALTSGFDVDARRARADAEAFLARLCQALD